MSSYDEYINRALIYYVKKYPCVWDEKDKNYGDLMECDRAWNEIAIGVMTIFDKDIEYVKTHWQRLRYEYFFHHSHKDPNWKYYRFMKFLSGEEPMDMKIPVLSDKTRLHMTQSPDSYMPMALANESHADMNWDYSPATNGVAAEAAPVTKSSTFASFVAATLSDIEKNDPKMFAEKVKQITEVLLKT